MIRMPILEVQTMVHDRFLYEPVRHVWTAESWQPTKTPHCRSAFANECAKPWVDHSPRSVFFSLTGISWNSWHYPRKYVLPPYRKCLPTSVRA